MHGLGAEQVLDDLGNIAPAAVSRAASLPASPAESGRLSLGAISPGDPKSAFGASP
ncbi:MAG TPA: hypothetical protein VLM11_02840 [Streptosporangiaceae bacterium]|nr:hypothetical protein [Streptosporangiaceae bacterium]